MILNLSNVFFVVEIYTSGVRKLRNKVVKVITDVPNNVVEITPSKEMMCRGKDVKLLEKTSIEQNLEFRNTVCYIVDFIWTLWFYCSRSLQLFGFPIFDVERI